MSEPAARDPRALQVFVFRLEGERTVLLAELGRVPGVEARLEAVDAHLEAAIAALGEAGVAYPAHAVAHRYGFSEGDYLLLQLGLLPWHGPEAVRRATTALGEAAAQARVSHAAALLVPGADDWRAVRRQIATLPIVVERLVSLAPIEGEDAGDAVIVVGQALRELLGLDEIAA
ncbi:MAG: hypothetical protein KC635_23340 [Myxococcales bacterium]|nr:hypothetical protein [Myxococcales bacterium]MCB9731410.1 hypothetical protein [Deltaproteobacteria bacterium]